MSDKPEVNVKKGSFISNMATELKKVIWPTGEQTVKSTGTVILFVLIITAILVVLNLGFQWLNNEYWNLIK
jgi:preprotein translocase subunit SecE